MTQEGAITAWVEAQVSEEDGGCGEGGQAQVTT